MSKRFKIVLSFLPCFKASKQTNSLSLSLVALSVAALFFSQASPAFANNFSAQAEQSESAARAAQAKQAESLAQTAQAVNAEQVRAAEQTQEQPSASYGDFEVTGEASTVSFTDPVLTISGGEHAISMKEGVTSTADRIEVTGASTLTLSGVSIETASGPALKIADDATFNVEIVLAANTKNTLTATANNYAALQKRGKNAAGTLTISGNGALNATGGPYAAGIGGGGPSAGDASTRNIVINSGIITASCRIQGQEYGGAGIGGGYDGAADYITIYGGFIKATGGLMGAGIGAGGERYGSSSNYGSHITLAGGVIEAQGRYGASGIGGNKNSSTDNMLNGDATVIASSDAPGTQPLAGFDGTTGFVKGIVFTNPSPNDGQPWTTSVYGNATTITTNPQATDATSNTPVELPADLSIPTGKTVTVGSDVTLTMATGKTITVEDGANLINASTTLAADFPVTLNGTGTLSSEMNYYRKGTNVPYLTNYQVYKTSAGVQKYKDLPNPDTTNAFTNWYYLNDAGQRIAIKDGDSVLLNEHNFYEEREDVDYTITAQPQGEGTIQPSATKAIEGATVTFTLAPKTGYKVEDGSVAVMAGATSVSVTDKGNLTYSFTMPASNVVISATFVSDSPTPPGPTPPGPTPGPTPDPTPAPTPDVTPASDDASLLPVTGDTQYASISALLAAVCTGMALLGMAGILKCRRD